MPGVAPLISAHELHSAVAAPDLAIVDCRHDLKAPAAGRQAYLEGHIPGARHASLDEDLAARPGPNDGRHPLPAPERAAATCRRLGLSADSRVVVYDDCGGAMAARLWWMLRWLGHERVSVLDGGLQAWQADIGQLESGSGRPLTPGRFVASTVRDDWVVTTAELEALLEAHRVLLLDARARNRFEGNSEPIDPVAGHVPGATNLPFDELLRADGRFRSRDALEATLRPLMSDRAPEDVVAMCGSGVTACHLLLGLEIAELGTGRLYVGSWSEWIRDERRPIGRGAADDSPLR